MIVVPQSQARRQRLNPFAFPTNTTTRFVLLIVAVIGTSLFLYDALYFAFPVNSEATRLAINNCNLSTAGDQCIVSHERLEAFWDLIGIVFLFSVSILLYWIWPLVRIRRQQLKPLPVSDKVMESMQVYLLALSQEARLSRHPRFLISVSISSIATFGRLGYYSIAIPAGSVIQFQSNLPLFRAAMLHEFSHIYNADVDKAYFSRALVWTFAFAALLPWLLAQFIFFNGFGQLFFEEFGMVLVLTGIIYLTLLSLLRAREVYADVRASVWDGPAGALESRVASLQASKESLLKRLLAVHPDPQVRMDLLRNTSGLFRTQSGQAFVTGLLVSSILLNIVWLVNRLHIGEGWWADHLASGLAGVVFAVIVAGTTGVDLWRATFAQKMQEKRQPGILIITGTLTLGLLVGQLLSFITLATGEGYFTDAGLIQQETNLSWWSWSILLLTWSIVLFIILFASFRWIICVSAQWLEIVSSIASPLRIMILMLGLSCIVLSIWSGEFNFLRSTIDLIVAQHNIQTGQGLLVGPLYYWYQTLQSSGHFSDFLLIPILTLFSIISPLLVNPLILILFLCVWTLPLASWFWRKRRTALANSPWAYLDQPSQVLPAPQLLLSPFLPFIFCLADIVCGITFCLIIPLLSNLPLWQALDNQMVLAVLFQAIIAGIVASLSPRLRVAHGLGAAFIAGCIMALGLIGWDQLYHTLDLTYQATFLWTVNGGAFVALLITSMVTAFTDRGRLPNRSG